MNDVPAVVLLGIVIGLQAALLAVGLVLVYRASRFINFAQGQMGAIAASTLAVLVFVNRMPYWAALIVALAVGVLMGVAIERLLGWRLFDKSRLALLVATIGVSQLVLLAIVAGPLKVDPTRLSREGYPQPFPLHWDVGGLVLNFSQVTTIVVGPLIAIGLFVFLKRSRTGRAIRGASSNPDAARLSGISVRRVSLIVWMLAALVSSFSAILYAPSQPGVTFGDFGPGLLMRGLAAALIAGMLDFRLAFAAGIFIGIVEQTTIFYTDVAGLADLSVAVVLVVGLLVRAKTLGRDVISDEGLVIEASEPPAPERVRHLFVVRRAGHIGWLALFALVALAPLFPGLQTQERAVFLLFMLSFAIVGLGLTVLTGWAGQVSLGQFALLGVGAYAASYLDRRNIGLPLMLAGAGLAAAGASALVGLVAVRFRGLFLGIVTLAFAFVARGWLFRREWLTEDSGSIVHIENVRVFGLEIDSVRGAYAVGVIVLVLTVAALRSLRRSGVGRAIIAVRDNDDLAASFGMTPVTVKLVALAVAGFITGVGGSLWGMAQQTWTFSAFDPTMSFVMLSVVIVGGIGRLYGPILGTIAVFAWPYLVPDANTLAIRSFTSGILVLVTLLFFPGGIASLVVRARQWLVARLAQMAPEKFEPRDGCRPLEARGVSIAFGGIRAVQDASIYVDPGEIVGLIGGNGAGKSTLINCISGHVRLDQGEILVNGQDVAGLAPEFRPFLGLNRTFQDARLFPGLSVAETVMTAMDPKDRSGAVGALVWAPWVRRAERHKRERADEILASFGLADRADSLAVELSTGMRRVCDMAAMVASDPTVVLLDEPTAGLAQREAEAFAPLLRRIRDEHGWSMLVVEHDMPLMMALCDRIYCLEEGQVIAEGSPSDIRSNQRVIASYLGAASTAMSRPDGPDAPAGGTQSETTPRPKVVKRRRARVATNGRRAGVQRGGRKAGGVAR